MRVPFFDYSRLYSDDKQLILDAVENVGRRGAYIMQSDLKEFEAILAKYVTTDFALGVGNATDGLEIIWNTIGLKPGDEVIISTHTMLATASAIIMAGGTPIPVDIRQDGLIDPEAVEAAITSNTVGISPTQLNGRTCQMDKLIHVAKKNNLVVVEDAAQGLGSEFKGQKAGSFGEAAVFSFYPAKILGCLGDGGAITTNISEFYEKIYRMHDHGRGFDGAPVSWGRNSRLDNLQAAILNAKFNSFEKVIERRREIALRYHEILKDVEQVILPEPPRLDTDNFDTFQNFEIVAEKRNELQGYLKNNGVGTLIQWGGKSIHEWELLDFNERLPVAELYFQKCLMLPINLFISDDDVHFVAQMIKDFYNHNLSKN
jgi:dTDP-4-amino-4,6-dideoxygalactose transaminase